MRKFVSKKKKRALHPKPRDALKKLSEMEMREKKVISATGTAVGLSAGVVIFGCPGGIWILSLVGLLSGRMVGRKMEASLSKRALGKRLKAVVGRPSLASKLAERYSKFPICQKAILQLGGVKLEGNLKQRQKQRKRLAADRMKKEDVKKFFDDWVHGKTFLDEVVGE